MGISHYVLQCTDLISRLFCVSHSYTVFSTGNLKFSIYFSENHSYNMFHNVHFTLCSTVCRSDFLGFSVQLTHIFFSTLCVSHFLFFSATQKRTVIYNMHLTPCSTVCLSDFLGVSVQLTHIFFLQCAFLIFCFSVQLINILCFTMCISHYVLHCAGLIF